ncbi:MAG: elongation factor G [Victivallaceae bacterium]|nr:elongation factor G [Victivallaceae bacterium]
MKSTEIKNFVIAGHSGAGKSSLCEQMLFKAKTTDRLGSIEAKTTVSDYAPDEREKLSSIYASVLNCEWRNKHFFFIDTPGYAEYVGEPVAAISVADAALVVIDAIDGPQFGTAKAWKLAREAAMPRMAFVNRMDKDRADFAATLELMRRNHGKSVIIPVTYPVGNAADFTGVVNVLFDNDVPSEIADAVAECRGLLMDAIAETDEDLMMRYLDGETIPEDEVRAGLKAAVKACKVIPVFAGSSTKDIGVTELMDAIADMFPEPLDRKELKLADGGTQAVGETGPGEAFVFKVVNDPFMGQLAYFKVVTGVLKSDCDVTNLTTGNKDRLGSLLTINGKSQTPVSELPVGAIGAVAKLKDAHISNTLSMDSSRKELEHIKFPGPVMSYAVSAAKAGEDEKVASGLAKIAECDQTVHLSRQEETHEFLLSGMGDIHLANVVHKLKDIYKAEAALATPKIPYRETITSSGEGHYRHKKQTGGAGQFAEVMLKIEYNEPGYEFVNAVVGGSIPRNFIPAVEKGVAETLAKGPLVGCTVERVKVSILDGKYHPVDSSEMAFKIAARMAFRDAMAKAHPVLLEPIMKVNIHVPDSNMGDVSGDLNHKRGRILGMGMEDGMQVIRAEIPLAELSRYATELRSMTQGKGSFDMTFDRYEQVPSNVANEIIAKHQAEQVEE